MPVVRFTNEDFLAGKVLKPSLYHVLIKNIITKAAKTDQSAVYHIQMKIVQPGDYFGVPLTDYISEKAEGTAIPFVRACNGGVDPKPDENYELNNGIGKVVKVQVGNDLYNGRVKNTINDYFAADADFRMSE